MACVAKHRVTGVSEVDDHVACCDDRPTSGWSDARIGVAIEGQLVKRLVVGDFRTELDLRREPMLPGERYVRIVRCNSGTLPLRVHEEFSTEGKVVQLVRGIIDVEQEGLLVGGAGERHSVTAMCRVRSIKRDKLRTERRATARNDSGSRGIVEVRHIVLVNVPGFK